VIASGNFFKKRRIKASSLQSAGTGSFSGSPLVERLFIVVLGGKFSASPGRLSQLSKIWRQQML
jgi:hypothetical protein